MEHQNQELDNNLKTIKNNLNNCLYNNNSNNNSNNSIMIENGLNYYPKNKQEDMIPSNRQQQIDVKLSEENLNDINNLILQCDDLPTAILPNNENNYNTSSTELILPLSEQDNQELGAIATSPTNSSLHNSTDNLSYTPDNNFNVEDLLLFQNNISGDDDDDDERDSVRSDNCIYAYRGGVGNDVNEFVMNLHNHNQYNQENDDETDFLEMDFDPDPLSEIEPQNFKDNHIDQIQQNEFFCNEIGLNEIQNCQKDYLQINRNIKILPVELSNSKNHTNEINLNKAENYELKSKLTGAKPKKVPIDLNKFNDNAKLRKHNFSQQKSLDSSVDLLLLNDDNKKESSINFNELLIKESNDEMCLDCLEKEFLLKTVGNCTNFMEKQCMKCEIKNNKNNSKSMLINKAQCDYTFPMLNENHDYIFCSSDLCETIKSTESSSYLNQRRSSCTSLSADLLNLKLGKENFKFSTSNVNASILVQALEKIKVEYNETIIRNHFENERKLFKDVYELILYKSKNNSNYKKLIKLLKLASKEELEFSIEIEIIDTKFHTVQIFANDIITCWNTNNDLSKLKTLDKRFAEINVLGKIVNLIRKKQQDYLKLSEYILVPQYYKARNIILSKKYIN